MADNTNQTHKIGVAVLAAGKGTRLKIDVAKPLLPFHGRVMIDYILDSVKEFASHTSCKLSIGAIVGYQKELLTKHLSEQDSSIQFATQHELNGTAGALKAYFEQIESSWENDFTLILCADTPLLTPDIFTKLYQTINAQKDCQGVCATFKVDDPTGYGRIVRGSGKGFKIVEHKDADEKQLEINEVNSGLYLIKNSYIKKYLGAIDSNNASGEFYLTDLFKEDENVEAFTFSNPKEFMGVNTLVHWEEANKELQLRKNQSLQLSGVFLKDSSSTYIDWKVKVGQNTVIYPNVRIEGDSEISANVIIENNAVIKDSKVLSGAHILSHTSLEEAIVGENSSVGPYARLRPGADIGSKAKIGNFVEIKKSKLHEGAKVSHLSYVGDAEVGAASNIGCGFITCNYDGANKHKTIIGAGTFVGSDVQMVAPVTIGDKAFIAAGSTITQDVPSGGFAVARGRQTTKEGMAKKFLKTK